MLGSEQGRATIQQIVFPLMWTFVCVVVVIRRDALTPGDSRRRPT